MLDRHWSLIDANAAAVRLIGVVGGPDALAVAGGNAMRLLVHPDGLRPAIANFAEVGGALDVTLSELVVELFYPTDAASAAALEVLAAAPAGGRPMRASAPAPRSWWRSTTASASTMRWCDDVRTRARRRAMGELDDLHRRPDGTSDATVAALGTLGEAVETMERARGHLYAFHQLCGTTDLRLGEAAQQLRDAGHDDIADSIDRVLVGRNVVKGRWSFQVVEEYDDGYWSVVRDVERRIRDELVGGARHVFEAEMKADRIDPDRARQRPTP